MAAKKPITWGEWVWRRAEQVGYRRQDDLARTIECSRKQLVNWLAMASPPKQMRKGFDRKLALALFTNPSVLFVEWHSHTPESLPVVFSYRDLTLVPHHRLLEPTNAKLRHEVLTALDLLTGDEEEKILLQIAVMILQKKDDRADFFRDMLDRMSILSRFCDTALADL